MGELGSETLALHRSIGEFALAERLNGLWTTGELSLHASEAFHDRSANQNEESCSTGGHFEDQQSLIDDLHAQLGGDVTVLVKGSRSSRMEGVVNGLVYKSSAPNAASAGDRP